VNFIAGFEMELETAQLLRQHFKGVMYCDLHSLMLAVQPGGLRTPQPLPNAEAWFRCFDVLQVNEDEMALLAPDPMALAASALGNGARCLLVTLGKRGAVYFAAPGFDTIGDLPPRQGLATAPRGGTGAVGAIRTALVPAEVVNPPGDPTGCGDVWGATYFSRMVAGDSLSDAMKAAVGAAARNVGHRGATGLAAHLRGELSLS
jgi:sugar/nucleoside kinase (ribokinase family)